MGTLFLDDVDRLPLSAQARLMQLLDDGVFRGSHASTGRPIELKIIARCRSALLDAVREGRFRADLYYRLDMARLVLPPLRERKADLPLLFAHFINEALPKTTRVWPEITENVRRHLIDHNWPGNARELKTFAVRFALGLLEPARAGQDSNTELSLSERTRMYEESLIREALLRCNGDVSTAVAELKLPKKTFYDKLARHKIDINNFRSK